MSTSKNGKSEAVVAYVTAHPGCSSDDIEAATACSKRSGLLCYLVTTGKVQQVGPRSMRRYYATLLEVPAGEHERLCALVQQRAAELKKLNALRDNARRTKRRMEDALYRKAEAQAQKRRKDALRLSRQHEGVKVTVAPPFVDPRYAVGLDFERVITNDWREQRMREQHSQRR